MKSVALQTFSFIISLLDTSFIRALQCPTKYFVVVTADCGSDIVYYQMAYIMYKNYDLGISVYGYFTETSLAEAL